MKQVPTSLLILGLSSLLAGCSKSSPALEQGESPVASYASLPGLAQTHDERLQAELKRLISERATPELLGNDLSRRKGTSFEIPAVRYNGNLAVEKIFPLEERSEITPKLNRAYPVGTRRMNARQLKTAQQLTDEYAKQQSRFRRMLDQPNLGFALDHTQGLGADTSFVDGFEIGCRLELLATFDLVEHGQLPEAIDRLESLFRGVQTLAKVGHLVPRITAVHLRRELLEVVQSICTHDAADHTTYQRLQQVILEQIERWPDDTIAWIGERAAGLHTYELIRDGYLLSVLSYEELTEFRDEVGIDRLGQLVMKNLDEDEYFYLMTMRQAIRACEDPYFKRRRKLARLREELERRRDEAMYPIIADHLLLGDLVSGQRLQAVDRARLQAWALALLLASDPTQNAEIGKRDERRTNPLTGHPFVVDLRPNLLIVDGIDPEDPHRTINIPVREAPTATARI